MQTFLQVKQVIDYSQLTHQSLRHVYKSINTLDQPERVKMLLDYLIAEQDRIGEILANFEANSAPPVLDNWMQYAPSIDIHELLKHHPIKPEMTLDDVVQLATHYSELLVDFYREAANEADLPLIRDIFNNLAEMELKDNQKQNRAALFEGM